MWIVEERSPTEKWVFRYVTFNKRTRTRMQIEICCKAQKRTHTEAYRVQTKLRHIIQIYCTIYILLY